MIERTHLKILQAIDRQGSLTAAAESLYLTQSALSHTIKKLEGQIRSELWVKDGRNIRLTQAGEYLLKEAKRVLPQLERIDETLSRFANKEQGSLHIGMECHPCYQWLLKVVAPFLEHFPGVDLDVKQRFQFGGIAALFNHDIDILVTPDPIWREGIVFEPVFPYEQVLVVYQDNPLAAEQWLSPDQLTGETLFTYPVEIERLDIFQQFLLPAHCRPQKHKTLEATEIILQMVAANRGVATLPAWLGREYAENLPIALVRLGKEGIQKQIFLGVRQQDEDNPHIGRFIQLAKETGL
ncbi:LysR family transcriptional regulator [Oceanospirillum maris]|uniref:LysR family transcriptional regulator n=1 Tax=Oceanospirillum maris TaxID=64977 RepID=UPI0004272846|nr:LysR family transcriptional regulator [Oceanospirillum maris]